MGEGRLQRERCVHAEKGDITLLKLHETLDQVKLCVGLLCAYFNAIHKHVKQCFPIYIKNGLTVSNSFRNIREAKQCAEPNSLVRLQEMHIFVVACLAGCRYWKKKKKISVIGKRIQEEVGLNQCFLTSVMIMFCLQMILCSERLYCTCQNFISIWPLLHGCQSVSPSPPPLQCHSQKCPHMMLNVPWGRPLQTLG